MVTCERRHSVENAELEEKALPFRLNCARIFSSSRAEGIAFHAAGTRVAENLR